MGTRSTVLGVAGLALIGAALFALQHQQEETRRIANENRRRLAAEAQVQRQRETAAIQAAQLAAAEADKEWKANREAVIADVKGKMARGDWVGAYEAAHARTDQNDPVLIPLENAARGKYVDAQVRSQERDKREDEATQRRQRRTEGVELGMTKDEVLQSSWGTPERVNATKTAFGEREQWVYGRNRYLYFDNGHLSSIQQSR